MGYPWVLEWPGQKHRGTAGCGVWWGWKLPVRINHPAHCPSEYMQRTAAPHRTAPHCNCCTALPDCQRETDQIDRRTDRKQTRRTSAEWSNSSDPPTPTVASPICPPPLRDRSRDRSPENRPTGISMNPGLAWGPGLACLLRWPPMAAALGRLASFPGLPDCPEKKVRALGLLARLCQQVKSNSSCSLLGP